VKASSLVDTTLTSRLNAADTASSLSSLSETLLGDKVRKADCVLQILAGILGRLMRGTITSAYHCILVYHLLTADLLRQVSLELCHLGPQIRYLLSSCSI
jgi:hypothetical protein